MLCLGFGGGFGGVLVGFGRRFGAGLLCFAIFIGWYNIGFW